MASGVGGETLAPGAALPGGMGERGFLCPAQHHPSQSGQRILPCGPQSESGPRNKTHPFPQTEEPWGSPCRSALPALPPSPTPPKASVWLTVCCCSVSCLKGHFFCWPPSALNQEAFPPLKCSEEHPRLCRLHPLPARSASPPQAAGHVSRAQEGPSTLPGSGRASPAASAPPSASHQRLQQPPPLGV